MMPDFPDFKAKLWEKFQDWMKQEMIRKEPLLGAVSRFSVHEGKEGETLRSDGTRTEFSLRASDADMHLTREEMRHPNLKMLLQRISEMAEKIAADQVSYMLSQIDQAVREAGNVTDAKGRPFGKDTFLEALSKVEVSFDSITGAPNAPSLLIDPSKQEEFQRALAKMESDPDFHQRYAEIMKRKREEWDARESRRVLVD